MKKKEKVEWELHQSFQDTWVINFLWVKSIPRLDDKMLKLFNAKCVS